ncbi:MAG: flavodoxin family protein [Candidatus Hydrogenedentes bacterium]|nr:flavodoxin family protein [Candidatus Hydrogenedentota bacterium]
MKVIAISGSPRRGSSTDQLVREVLEGVEECEKEFISLAGKSVAPCRACLGCVETNVCVINDDFVSLREKVIAADGYIIGGPNYFNMLNGLTHAFLERWYQFRHRAAMLVAGRVGVAVGVGGGSGQPAADAISTFFKYNGIECIGDVTAQGAASCFTCGHGETCTVGAIHASFPPGTKITDDITPSLCKQPAAIAKARSLGKQLGERLTGSTTSRQARTARTHPRVAR